MKVKSISSLIAASLAAASLASSPVAAQLNRTFVSGKGNDANSCYLTAPCRTFAGALVKTNAGGEINALDTAGYGTVIIDKAVTIDGAGTRAGIVGSTLVAGVQIAAGPNDVVRLLNLSIGGAGATSGKAGIHFLTGKALHVEDLLIHDVQYGIDVWAPTSHLGVLTTSIRDVERGVNLRSVATGATATLDRVSLLDSTIGLLLQQQVAVISNSLIARNGAGVQVNAGGRATISNCTVTHNSVAGLQAFDGSLSAEDNVISHNQIGIYSDGATSLATISSNVIFDNTAALMSFNGAVYQSFGNNKLHDNTSSPATITTLAMQ